MLSINQIFNGDPSNLDIPNSIGLVPALRQHVDERARDEGTSESDVKKIHSYLDFVHDRASGDRPTGARFIRDIVMKHEGYQHDSEVSSTICYDIVQSVKKLMDEDLAHTL